MCQFIESVKIRYGRMYNLEYHNARVQRARRDVLGIDAPLHLQDHIKLPASIGRGLYKCRIVYGERIEQVTIEPYRRRRITSLKLVDGGSIEYAHKYLDRTRLEGLFAMRGLCDDILIVCQGLITDTSYANVALLRDAQWYTPVTPLLRGTKRQQMLDSGALTAMEISVDDLGEFSRIAVFNAMMDLEEKRSVDMRSVISD